MNYQEFKAAVVEAAKARDIKDYELYYSQSRDTSVSVYQTEVKDYSTDSTMGVCFRCIVDGRLGYASTENMTGEEAVSVVERAVDNASSIESGEPVFIHGKGDVYGAYEKKEMKEYTGKELIDFARKLQSEVYGADSRVKDGTESAAGFGHSECALYNSNGLDLSNSADYSYAYAMAIVAEGEEMYDGFEMVIGDMGEFDAKKVADKAVEEAVSAIGYSGVESGRYDIVFSGQVMSSLLATFSSVFSAESVQKGMSLLKDKEGTQIAADIVTLTDDPMYECALVKHPFDDEGAATYKKNVIEGGKLNTLLHNLKTAAKAGVKTTGNAHKGSYAAPVGIGYYSFYINPVKGTKEELMEQAGEGIYLTDVTGLHAGANPITGDFSLSSSGFRIEKGKKAGPIRNFTVSGNFYELLKNITAVGTDLEFRKGVLGSRTGSPSVLVPQVTVAGK